MSRRKNFRQSNWLIELSPRKICRAANSRNTLLFSRLDISPPGGDPALKTHCQPTSFPLVYQHCTYAVTCFSVSENKTCAAT